MPTLYERLTANPEIVVGCLGTAGILVGGLLSFRNGDSARAQKMMRLRVGAQFATLVLITACLYRQQGKSRQYVNNHLALDAPPPTLDLPSDRR